MIDLVAEQSPLGGLERWLDDPAVSEVMVNAGTDIWVERGGRLLLVGRMRTSTVLAVIEHVLAPTGRRLDRSHPTVDARLPDGSRLCATIQPIAVDGPCLAIRRFASHDVPLEAFAPPAVVALLTALVRSRCNLVVSGATSSGKTTLLNALAHQVEPQSRIITLEDVAELRLHHEHVVRLETREATPDGVGEIPLAHLLRTALRMRPDRLVVGEVRGAEAVHLLQALNTGHDGSLCTVHANSALDALTRLATLVLQESGGWPLAAVHYHVARAVDVVVHVARDADGGRRVVEVAEVCPSHAADPALTIRPLATGERVLASLDRGRA
jgi:pilus assembly protein CpaF